MERTYEKPKNEKGIRHNTVSHSIIELRRSPRKPYVLNQRKTDTIKYAPEAPEDIMIQLLEILINLMKEMIIIVLVLLLLEMILKMIKKHPINLIIFEI